MMCLWSELKAAISMMPALLGRETRLKCPVSLHIYLSLWFVLARWEQHIPHCRTPQQDDILLHLPPVLSSMTGCEQWSLLRLNSLRHLGDVPDQACTRWRNCWSVEYRCCTCWLSPRAVLLSGWLLCVHPSHFILALCNAHPWVSGKLHRHFCPLLCVSGLGGSCNCF